MHAHFHEVRAEGGLLGFLAGVAEVDLVLGDQGLCFGGLGNVCGAAAVADLPVAELGRGRVEAQLLRNASRSFTQAAYTPAVEQLPPACPPEPVEAGKRESPSCTFTFSSGRPSISAAVWAMMV